MITQQLKQACEVLNLLHMLAVYDQHAEEISRDSISHLEFLPKVTYLKIDAKRERTAAIFCIIQMFLSFIKL